jgi:peptidoglycan/LPS O-acetylase OafA/YrhL
MTSVSVARRLDPRRNSLNFLRLVFALLVIVSHAWPVGGYGADPELAGLSLGGWAVVGFFGISGYLITKSRMSVGFTEFVGRRILRIYPGYLVCLLVTALVFAPASVALGSGSIRWTSAFSFIGHNIALKLEQNGIADTLGHAPVAGAWNGSLWTLFYEFLCYLAVGVLLFATRGRGALVVAALVATAVGDTVLVHGLGVRAGTVENFAWLAAPFFAGAVLAIYADRVPLTTVLGVPALVLAPVAAYFQLLPLLGAIPVAYACLWLGHRLPAWRIGRRNDLSYGIYIYAFPVQQSLTLIAGNRLPVGLAIALSIVGTVPLAALSWFLVEERALRLKDQLPVLIGFTDRLIRRAQVPVELPDAAGSPRAAD